jgi:hypothetical protein
VVSPQEPLRTPAPLSSRPHDFLNDSPLHASQNTLRVHASLSPASCLLSPDERFLRPDVHAGDRPREPASLRALLHSAAPERPEPRIPWPPRSPSRCSSAAAPPWMPPSPPTPASASSNPPVPASAAIASPSSGIQSRQGRRHGQLRPLPKVALPRHRPARAKNGVIPKLGASLRLHPRRARRLVGAPSALRQAQVGRAVRARHSLLRSRRAHTRRSSAGTSSATWPSFSARLRR